MTNEEKAAAEKAAAEKAAAEKTNEKKTTPDEGLTFKKDTVFVCVQDCYTNGVLYRRGDTVKGKQCPPWFKVQAAAEDGGEE